MLERDFDIMVVGRNYHSLLFAIGQARLGQKVLLLDDPRMGSGDSYGHGLGAIEYHFLKTWGRDFSVGPLQSGDDYFEPCPLDFFFHHRWTRLNSTPSHNMLELLRRFSTPLGEEGAFLQRLLGGAEQRRSFDLEIERFVTWAGQNAFRRQSTEALGVDFFLAQCPPHPAKIFKVLRQYLEKNRLRPEGEIYLLISLARAFFLKNLSPEMASDEIFYTFINLLAPSYSFHRERLERDLEQFFLAVGGQLKRTQVREWKFHRGRPWCLELASFEGIIHPRKVAFVGEELWGVPLKLGGESPSYRALVLENWPPAEEMGHLPPGNFVFGDFTKMGTSFPLWWLESPHWASAAPPGQMASRRPLRIHFLARRESGSKVEFLRRKVLVSVESDLAQVFPWMLKHLGEWKVEMGREIYIRESRPHKRGLLPLGRRGHLFDYSSPSPGRRIKNVYYFGPLLESPLGRLGRLMEMKQEHYYL